MDAKERHYSIELAEEVINASMLKLICEDHQVEELMVIIGYTVQAESRWIYESDVMCVKPICDAHQQPASVFEHSRITEF